MRHRLLHEIDGQRTFAVVFETGHEIMAGLDDLARGESIDSAGITGIGAFSEAVLAYFDWEKKEYLKRSFVEQLEVASLIGDIAVNDQGQPALHVHLVLGRRDYSALAGHLISGRVRPTLELIITELPAHLRRRKDPETGLALIDL